MARGVMNFRNAAPKGELAADATRKEVIVEFARRLQAELVRRGVADNNSIRQKQKVLPLKWFYGGKEPADNPFLKEAYEPAKP